MSSPFHVDLEHLDNVAARLKGLVGFLTDHLDEVDRSVAGLHQSSWSGVAARAHVEAAAKWSTEAREFSDGAAVIQEAARLAHEAYTGAVDANTKMFRRR
jgi:WXG100 family type VII secretion target